MEERFISVLEGGKWQKPRVMTPEEWFKDGTERLRGLNLNREKRQADAAKLGSRLSMANTDIADYDKEIKDLSADVDEIASKLPEAVDE